MIKRDKLCTIIFSIAYFFMLSFSLLGHIPTLGGYLNLLSKISIGLFPLIIFMQINRYQKKEILLGLFFLIISILIMIKNGEPSLFKLFLVLFSMKGIKFDDCIKFDVKIRTILVFITIFLCFIGIAPDVTSFYEGSYKHSLGFSNPNAFGMHTLIVTIEIMYLNKKKLSLSKTIFLLLILFIVDSYAGCRTSFMIFFIVFALFKLLQYMPNILENKVIKFVVKNSFLLFSILTFSLYILYKNGTGIGILLNDIFSNRLLNINIFSKLYGVGLLGNDLSSAPNTLDTLYAYCLYGYGLLIFISFIIIFKKFFKYLYEKKMYKLIIVMFSFFIYGISERLWFMIDYNIFISSLSLIFFSQKKAEIKEEKNIC